MNVFVAPRARQEVDSSLVFEFNVSAVWMGYPDDQIKNVPGVDSTAQL